ncbi:MAG TPA: hypothetical protein VJN96_05620 [Vicinamibacterales bacterium]|nr:hypothetical protein [Vicinamibacterales bacterium]
MIDSGRTAVWIEGETARVRLPRAGWRGAAIRLVIRPAPLDANTSQEVAASLNGRAIGRARLTDGWQEIVFPASARDWIFGFNVLDLQFAHVAPSNPATGDQRSVSAAIDRIDVR